MMAIKKARKESPSEQRRKRISGKSSEALAPRWSRARLTAIGLFAGFTALVIMVCFVGLSPAGPQVVKDQVARTRVVAEFPFSYLSELETERAAAELRQRIPPVYRIAQEPYARFREHVEMLHLELNEYLTSPGMELTGTEGPQAGMLKVTSEEMEVFLREHSGEGNFNINPEDLAVLANTLGKQRRAEVLSESLRVLGDLYQEGVYDRQHSEIRASSGSLSFFNIEQEDGRISEVRVLSEEEALRYLRINLTTLDIPREASVSLYRLIRAGLKPNLVFDQGRTNAIIEEAVNRLEPRLVHVRQGETIIEPNARVTARQFEQLAAYREKLRESEGDLGIDSLLLERAMLAVAAVVVGMLFLKIQLNDLGRYSRLLVLAGLLVLVNLGLIRLVLALGEGQLVQYAPSLPLVLPWLVPIALGPMIIAILLGGASGAVAAGFIAMFSALMQGGSAAVLLVSLLGSLTAVYLCRGIQVRARVVRAGTLAGLVMAACALFVGLRNAPDSVLPVFQQMLAAILTGAVTGTAVVGLLPVLENFFRHTTDITLLELTDFNHPLLRKMQVAAPGSYHHSLMVANLAENAAAAIGANTLLSRVASLYHDVGKIVKPEYFIENQREANPHIERNPSMSALIIKAHAKEGVILAKEYKLPRVIMDVIRQHHGTSLIQYFYYKALQRQQDLNASTVAPANACKVELDEVSESTYRYEGPKPQFIECAIIMLADSVEAASRSLKKVTPQGVEDFVDRIVQDRIDDGQLDEVPMTLQQIAKVKESFRFTLLNMLHTRVEYPKAEKAEKPERGDKKQTRNPFPTAQDQDGRKDLPPATGPEAPVAPTGAAVGEGPRPAPEAEHTPKHA